MSLRAVKQILETKPTIEGAGVKLQRAFGFGKTKEFDPFLLLDDFRNEAGKHREPDERHIDKEKIVIRGTARGERLSCSRWNRRCGNRGHHVPFGCARNSLVEFRMRTK